jgi:acetolactate synthase I/II/III large subunit
VRSEADVMLIVGSRVGNLDMPFDNYWGDPAGQRVIQIDIDPRHLGVTRTTEPRQPRRRADRVEGIASGLGAMHPSTRDPEDLARYRALDEQVRTAQFATRGRRRMSKRSGLRSSPRGADRSR